MRPTINLINSYISVKLILLFINIIINKNIVEINKYNPFEYKIKNRNNNINIIINK